MINREEIKNNIRELLKGHVEGGGKIQITLKSPKEAGVYIGGKLINTYLIEEKRFLNNIVIPEKIASEEFHITVVITRTDLKSTYAQYRGAELQLPATDNEIRDAMQRARVTKDNQEYLVTKCMLYDKDMAEEYKEQILDLEKLNYLAKVMNRFTKHEHALFRGYVEKKGPSQLYIRSLINIAYNLHCCDIIYDLKNDEELGRFYADNGMLSWLDDANKQIWEFLNYEKIGRSIRETDGGIYINEGYFTCRNEEFTEVYDGKIFPEEFEDESYIFKLLISPKQTEDENSGKWLSLPASKEGKQNFLRGLGVESFDNCILLAVQSMEANIPMCVKELSQIGVLNSLAHRMRDMERTGELAKYKAVLEGYGCIDLEQAITYANELHNYELYEKTSTIIEYAKSVFETKYKSVLPESFATHFNFATYAEELMKNEDLVLSEYGVLKYNRKEGAYQQPDKTEDIK